MLLLAGGCTGSIQAGSIQEQVPSDGGIQGADAGMSGTDAGILRPDAGEPVDAGPIEVRDAGAVACPAHAVFCESFESGALDSKIWTARESAGAVTVDATQGLDGTHALHVKLGTVYGLSGSQVAALTKGIPAPSDRLYMRAFLRFGDLKLPGYHPNLISVVGPDYKLSEWPIHSRWSFGSFLGEVSINAFGKGLDGGKLWTEMGNMFTNPDGDSTPATEHQLKAGEWFCVELMGFGDHQGPGDLSHDAEENRAWINGVEIPEMYGNDARWKPWGAAEHWSPPYDGSIWEFGIDGAYASTPTQDIWFDAIAFSGQRIGCAR